MNPESCTVCGSSCHNKYNGCCSWNRLTTLQGCPSTVTVSDCEPKREFWTNAYMEFCAQNRAEVKKEFPDYKPMEVSNELGKRWMNLTDSEKDEWKTYASEKNLRNGYL